VAHENQAHRPDVVPVYQVHQPDEGRGNLDHPLVWDHESPKYQPDEDLDHHQDLGHDPVRDDMNGVPEK
jgi:hypothetical protein